jgi:hypothetical protein
MRALQFGAIAAVLLGATFLNAATPAEQRMQAARELQTTFDGSLVKGFELKFIVRGSDCDVLHVEGYTNLTDGMMEALANGTLIYGRVLPGGVNQFAFKRGFRRIAYTNEEDPTFASFGTPRLTRKQVKQMRRCTNAIAAKLTAKEARVQAPAPPRFEPLSWATATVGRRLYDGAYGHDATIVSVNRAGEVITVKYAKSGSVESKRLDAVARFWYVRK